MKDEKESYKPGMFIPISAIEHERGRQAFKGCYVGTPEMSDGTRPDFKEIYLHRLNAQKLHELSALQATAPKESSEGQPPKDSNESQPSGASLIMK